MLKIAFMFLTINDVNNPIIWSKYFPDDKSKYNIYMHPKNPDEVKSFFKSHIINDLRPTSWGFIIDAYEALFKTAFNDDINNKYFVIVSESCLPITSFNQFYNFVIKNKYNLIEKWIIRKYDKEARLIDLKDFPKYKIIKHSAFFVLDRKTINELLHSPSLQLFKKMSLGEEFFLSIVYNVSKFKNHIVTYADWDWTTKKKEEYKKQIHKYLKLYEESKLKKYKNIADKYYKILQDISAHPKQYRKLTHNLINKGFKKGAFFVRKVKKFISLYNND
jgi:hypothetical protein